MLLNFQPIRKLSAGDPSQTIQQIINFHNPKKPSVKKHEHAIYLRFKSFPRWFITITADICRRGLISFGVWLIQIVPPKTDIVFDIQDVFVIGHDDVKGMSGSEIKWKSINFNDLTRITAYCR